MVGFHKGVRTAVATHRQLPILQAALASNDDFLKFRFISFPFL